MASYHYEPLTNTWDKCSKRTGMYYQAMPSSLQGTKGEEKEEDSKPASQQTAATPGPSEITSPGNQTFLFIED